MNMKLDGNTQDDDTVVTCGERAGGKIKRLVAVGA
jgi:hypothetical protein